METTPVPRRKRDILEDAMNGMMGCCDCDGNQAAFRDCGMEISRLRFENVQLRLTDEEREAVGVAIQCVVAAKAQRHPEEEESHALLHKTAATLHNLLERMGGER